MSFKERWQDIRDELLRPGVMLTFFLVVALDHLSKYAVRATLQVGEEIVVLPGFFKLTLVYNPGAAFGLFATLPDVLRRLVLALVTIGAVFFVIYYLINDVKGDRFSRLALAAILGGAAGNVIDRFAFDAVVDFLDFHISTYHWPAFNVADSSIFIGVMVLIIRMLVRGKACAGCEGA